MFKSACFRLTTFYVLIIMTLSVAFSVVLFNMSSHEINNGLTRQGNFFRQQQPGQMFNPFIDFEQLRQDQLQQSADNLRLDLLYFNILILLASSAISYALARRTLQPIEEMVEIQGRFVADASHELRTPLTAMKTELEVAIRKLDKNDESKKLLESNLEEVNKLHSLSNNLLKQAKYDVAHKKSKEKINVRQVVISAYKKVEAVAKKKQVDFEFDVNENSEILANKEDLEEILVIFMDNAVKYSQPSDKVIIKSIISTSHLELKIIDNGAGIKERDLPHIFERFYRADASRHHDQNESYGLGLSIAYSIAKINHWRLDAVSEIDKGSTFSVKIYS